MSETRLSGGCACGAVRYDCAAAPVIVAHCHCRDCQRASGAAMSTVFAVPRAALHSRGQTRSYATRGDSGNPVLRHFCGECGSPLYSEVTVLPDLQFVRAASLDNPVSVSPTMHIYCDSAQPWGRPLDDLPHFAKMPG